MRAQLLASVIFGLAAHSAPVAYAQTYDCAPNSMGMRCTPSAHEQFNRQMQQDLNASMARSQAMADPARVRSEAKKERKWREALGQAVLEGRCEDAKRMALERGDLAAADQAVRLCAPAQPPQAAAPVPSSP